ncbi:hypothetical protein E2320_003339, partial [Naja naja]
NIHGARKISHIRDRPALDEVEGILLPKSTCNEWARIQCFQAKPNDILLCTYPKSGTTWIQEIVDMIQQDGDLQKCQRAPVHYRHLFIEWARPFQPLGVDQADRMPSPRTLKTHLPIQLVPKTFWMKNCKNEQNVTPSWNMGGIFEDFHGRQGGLGLLVQSRKGLVESKRHLPCPEPKREIQKIAQFIGKQLDMATLDKIVHYTSFKS